MHTKSSAPTPSGRGFSEEIDMYAVTNAYEIRESLKAMGAKWDAAKKAWIITQDMLDKCNARTQAYGMAWCRGWAKASVAVV